MSKFIPLLFLFLLLSHSLVTLAEENKILRDNHPRNQNTLFILDASGSMWGQVNGKPKIAIAKEVMAKLVAELPDNNRIGLIAYGHRRKGDCSDVETLVKLSANDKQAVLKAVKGLNAKGKTPLTRSVNQAFKMLQSEEQASTIILVSDGIESCNASPCEAVKSAKASGINFILHTVGFGLSKKESVQLQCMADAGGGEYYQANNAEDLLKSTRKAVKSKGSGALKLTLNANGKPVNAWVKLTGDGSIGLADFTNDAGVKPGHIWHLKPGHYRLETYPAGLRGVNPIQLDNIKIESGKTVEKILSFDQAKLRVIATDNSKPAVVEIVIKNSGTNKTVYNSSTFSTFTMNGVKTPYEIKVLPGKYQLTVKLPKSSVPPVIVDTNLMSGGQAVEKTVIFETGVIRVIARVNGKPSKAEVRILESGTKHSIYETMPYVGAMTPLQVKLAVGSYDLFVTPVGIEGMDEKSIKNIKVEPGDNIDKAITFEEKLIVPDYVLHLGNGKWTAWDSSEGPMGLLDAGEGKYVGFYNKEDHGRLLLQRSGNTLTGYWVENRSNHRCVTERDGSLYWGRIKWEFDAEFNSFSGTWNYCDTDSAGEIWSGNHNAVKSMTTHAKSGELANGIEQDTDRPGGNDYRHFIPATANPTLCHQACMNDVKCKAWTYVKPDTIQGAQSHCWLKLDVPPAITNSCCNSGVKK